MKQIIYLLRLDFNNTTKIIILDEPSSALDENTRDNIIEFIKYLNSKGKTILLVTHDNFYKQICDKIILFSNDVNPQYQ
jgi:ABC-type lipoprotein export system ATPase subunit